MVYEYRNTALFDKIYWSNILHKLVQSKVQKLSVYGTTFNILYSNLIFDSNFLISNTCLCLIVSYNVP